MVCPQHAVLLSNKDEITGIYGNLDKSLGNLSEKKPALKVYIPYDSICNKHYWHNKMAEWEGRITFLPGVKEGRREAGVLTKVSTNDLCPGRIGSVS